MIIIELKLQCRSAAPASVPARDDIAASKDLVRQGALPPGAALDVSLERHQILGRRVPVKARAGLDAIGIVIGGFHAVGASATLHIQPVVDRVVDPVRSEEHTSELQSLMRISYAVFCLTKKTT